MDRFLSELEMIYQLRKRRNIVSTFVSKCISLTDEEKSWLCLHDKSYNFVILTNRVLQKHFPSGDLAQQIYPDIINKCNALYSSNSKYYRLTDGIYCGTFDAEFADRLLIMAKEKRHIDKLTKGLFYNAFTAFRVQEYSIGLLSRADYEDGTPLFIGESTNTCDTLGKLGSDLAVNAMLSPNLQIILIKKNLDDGSQLHLGHALLFMSQCKTKIILSSLETIYIPSDICCTILKQLCRRLYDNFKDEIPNLTIEIGIGGRTLRSLGYDIDNFPKSLVSKHLEVVRGIANHADYEVLMKYIHANPISLLDELDMSLDCDIIENSYGGCEVHEDSSRYRLRLLSSDSQNEIM